MVASKTRTGESKTRKVIMLSFFSTQAYTCILTVQCFEVMWTTFTCLRPCWLAYGHLVDHLGWWPHSLRTLPSKTCLKLMDPIQNCLLPSWDTLPNSWARKWLMSSKSRWGGFERHCCLYSFNCCFFQTSLLYSRGKISIFYELLWI